MKNNSAKKLLAFDLDLSELEECLSSWGEPKYRAKQIWRNLYINLWNNPDEMTNLSKSLRLRLENRFLFKSITPMREISSSNGETQKTLFQLEDGKATEAVLMRYKNRNTICVSSQAGCAMDCVFCATGQMGFKRNLSSGEIIEQILYYFRLSKTSDTRITNVVFMGMGEPFHNYQETMAAIDRLNQPDGLNFGARRFTVSTVGLIPAMQQFIKDNRQVNLSVSLHAMTDEIRSSLIPINRKYPLSSLLNTCEEYIQKTGRRITFEWALIDRVNDSADQARMLGKRLERFKRSGTILCHVNVIPLNPTEKYRKQASPLQKAKDFRTILNNFGISCSVRVRRGSDIQAGCGQLAIFGK